MVDPPSREPQAAEPSGSVDEGLKRRVKDAYLNDEEDVLVVHAVRSIEDGTSVVVEMRPPHGDATHIERFDAPKHGSLDECTDLLTFLEAAGVSPLDLDELVGTRVPATFDPETGWRVDERYVARTEDGRTSSRVGAVWDGAIDWLRTYRDWLLVILIVGVELLFVVVILLVFA